MAFKTEYVPLREDETSEFCGKALVALRTGFSRYDLWTIDHEREMVLFRSGGGHSMESRNDDYWLFLDADRMYDCDTETLSKAVLPDNVISIVRTIRYWGTSMSDVPDAQTLDCIKEAMGEYAKSPLLSGKPFSRCELTLLNPSTFEEM